MGYAETYDPHLHYSRTPEQKAACETWLAEQGWEPNQVQQLHWEDGLLTVLLMDRDPQGYPMLITIDGEQVLSTSLVKLAMGKPPEWWPYGRSIRKL